MSRSRNQPAGAYYPAPPPTPPRTIDAKVRRRSWMEPRVRVWWLSAIVLLVVAVVFTFQRIPRISRDRWLIENGRKVEARIVAIEGMRRANVRPEDPGRRLRVTLGLVERLEGTLEAQAATAQIGAEISIRLDPSLPGGWTDRVLSTATTAATQGTEPMAFGPITKARVDWLEPVTPSVTRPKSAPRLARISYLADARPLDGELDDQRDGAYVGKDLFVRMDPDNPLRWTDRLSVAWFDQLLVDIIIAPLIVVMVVMALLRRRSVLNIWREAPSAEAVVVTSRRSAFYPLSNVVSLTLAKDFEGRVMHAVVPQRAADLRPGDTLYVVAPRERPRAALLALLYE